MSSLEKVSSEDTDDKTLNSSDEDYDCDDGNKHEMLASLAQFQLSSINRHKNRNQRNLQHRR